VDLFVEMTTVHGLVPDEATMVGFITTAVRDLDGAFGGALINMYTRCGSMGAHSCFSRVYVRFFSSKLI
jgi:hypothetical protein